MKRVAPAAERNRAPILAVLRSTLPEPARILEIGSGTGQHADYFTGEVPSWTWQPTDADERAIESVAAYRNESERPGFLAPILLDVRTGAWPEGPFSAVFSANVIHIAPWAVAQAIIGGAERVLTGDGKLIFYGPFTFDGSFHAPSNAAFDSRLRAEDPTWGVRDVTEIRAFAVGRGFSGPTTFDMPANNHVLVFERSTR